MFNPVYKIRQPLPGDKKFFVLHTKTPHLIMVGAFGWRILFKRAGPMWWNFFARPYLFRLQVQIAISNVKRRLKLCRS